MTTRRKPTLVFGVAGVAAWLGVKAGTVTQWLEREKRGDVPPTPTPDILLSPGRSGVPDRGWLLERRDDWKEWRASLPGQGRSWRDSDGNLLPRQRHKPPDASDKETRDDQ